MKVALVLLLASVAFSQSLPASCGAADAKFEVKTDSSQHPGMQPADGKALLYFLEDDTGFGSTPKPTTREGVDGAWVGATHGNSFYSLSVDPGEHHLCASWQTAVIVRQGHQTAVAHFTAEAGGVYYFRVKNTWELSLGTAGISLMPLDSDEGKLLASKFSVSVFRLSR
jgi:hypothetical protein